MVHRVDFVLFHHFLSISYNLQLMPLILTCLLFLYCLSCNFRPPDSASGHVYVAKTLATGKKVAIKEMDLSHQPRKELIVNEILVMKESQHPNIVNFLESYLVKSNELWVVMEYMEGGALTDIIENNTLEEDQISSISSEVGFSSFGKVHAITPITADLQGPMPSA